MLEAGGERRLLVGGRPSRLRFDRRVRSVCSHSGRVPSLLLDSELRLGIDHQCHAKSARI